METKGIYKKLFLSGSIQEQINLMRSITYEK